MLELDYPLDFMEAINRCLTDEGGYVCDPNDPGGETNWGISKRSYPDMDIKALTREGAIAIYYRDWWDHYGYGQIRAGLSGKVMEVAINQGPHSAALALQRALRAVSRNLFTQEDGILGKETLAAVNSYAAPDALIAAFRSEAAAIYRMIVQAKPTSQQYLRGWLNRAYR